MLICAIVTSKKIMFHYLGGSEVKGPEGWYNLPCCRHYPIWPSCFTANTKEETEHVQFTSVWEEISEFYEQITK